MTEVLVLFYIGSGYPILLHDPNNPVLGRLLKKMPCSQVCLTVATRQSFWLVFDNVLASFRQLSDGFLVVSDQSKCNDSDRRSCQWNKVKMVLDNSVCPSSYIFIGHFKGSHQKVVKLKDVTKLSKANQKLCRMATVTMAELTVIWGFGFSLKDNPFAVFDCW